MGEAAVSTQAAAGKKALVTGATGQDGSYLVDLLLAKGYEVHCLIRRVSTCNTQRLPEAGNEGRLHFHTGDMEDGGSLRKLLAAVQPDEIYNLAAQSHVRESFELPEYTGNVTGLGTTRLLESVRLLGLPARFYQASSSEMFGNAPPPQSERSVFRPRSPYAAAKTYAYWISVIYRESYGMFVSNGILFNHESPRRGETFVTRKITRGLAKILKKEAKVLRLGNLEAKRDWGYAPEYVEMMWRMLQLDAPDDFAVGTGEAHSVQEFLEEAFSYAGLDWKAHVKIDDYLYRPSEVSELRADNTKASKVLGWKPRVTFKDLVRIMVDADLEQAGLKPIGEGKKIMQEKFSGWHRWENAVTSASRVALAVEQPPSSP